jgi:hypothetical protein
VNHAAITRSTTSPERSKNNGKNEKQDPNKKQDPNHGNEGQGGTIIGEDTEEEDSPDDDKAPDDKNKGNRSKRKRRRRGRRRRVMQRSKGAAVIRQQNRMHQRKPRMERNQAHRKREGRRRGRKAVKNPLRTSQPHACPSPLVFQRMMTGIPICVARKQPNARENSLYSLQVGNEATKMARATNLLPHPNPPPIWMMMKLMLMLNQIGKSIDVLYANIHSKGKSRVQK